MNPQKIDAKTLLSKAVPVFNGSLNGSFELKGQRHDRAPRRYNLHFLKPRQRFETTATCRDAILSGHYTRKLEGASGVAAHFILATRSDGSHCCANKWRIVRAGSPSKDAG